MKLVKQDLFRPITEFDSSRLNCHRRIAGRCDSVVVLIHGFDGRGYGTWQGLPGLLFDGGVDIAVYDYPTGRRKMPFKGANLVTFFKRQIANHLRRLCSEYNTVVVVGHSLGGVLASLAIQDLYAQTAFSGELRVAPEKGVAALVAVASPRSGAALARRPLTWIFPELRILRPGNPLLAEAERFYSDNIEVRQLAPDASGRFVVPLFVAEAGRDALVSSFSSSFGVPTDQRLPILAGHREIAKPTADNSVLADWIGEILSSRREAQQQVRRQRHRQVPTSHPRPAATAVVTTRLLTDDVTLKTEQLYDQCRKDAGTAEIAIEDEAGRGQVDMVICIQMAADVLKETPRSRALFQAAIEVQTTTRGAAGGYAPVGDAWEAAEQRIATWLQATPTPVRCYVRGVVDYSELATLLREWLELIKMRTPVWNGPVSGQLRGLEFTDGGRS